MKLRILIIVLLLSLRLSSIADSTQSPTHVTISTLLPEECDEDESFDKSVIHSLDLRFFNIISASENGIRIHSSKFPDIVPVEMDSLPRYILRFGDEHLKNDFESYVNSVSEKQSSLRYHNGGIYVSNENTKISVIKIFAISGELMLSGSTDNNGYFSVAVLPFGTYIAVTDQNEAITFIKSKH